MEQKTKQVEEKKMPPQRGSGAMLSAARKQQNKSIEEIADELNLSVTQLRTIELDQSEGLPEPTYVRGYIRSYAKLLGLNPEEVLDHYLNKNWQKSANLDDMPRGISDAESSSGSTFGAGKIVVVLVIAGVAAYFLYTAGFGDKAVRDNGELAQTTTVQSINTQTANTPAATAVTNQLPDAIAAAPDTDSRVNDAVNAVTDSASVDTAPSTQANDDVLETQPVESNQTRVVLTFTETSWVDIRDEEQNRLAYQSYPVGETLDVSAEGALSVLIGNAKGVNMTLNGQPYDLSQHTRGVYAKFSVGTPSE